MNVRPFTTQDAFALADLYCRCFSEPPWNEVFDPDEIAKEFEDMQTWPDSVLMVAEHDGQIIGGAVGFGLHRKEEVRELVPDEFKSGFYLADLFVDKNNRQKGVARELINKRREEAKIRGHSKAVVRTSEHQPIVQHIYLGQFNYSIHTRQHIVSTKLVDGEKVDAPDPRVIMIGYL